VMNRHQRKIRKARDLTAQERKHEH